MGRAGSIVAFFNKRTAPQQAPEPEPMVVEEGASRTRQKAGPTPSRREAERARMERLHPSLSPKEQRALDRKTKDEKRVAALAAVENSPERRLIRNTIDAHWHIAEFSMPALLVMMAGVLASNYFPAYLWILATILYAFVALIAVDIWLTWRKVKRTLRDRLGTTNFRGLFTYTMNRAMQIRRFRNPPAVIKRGDSY